MRKAQSLSGREGDESSELSSHDRILQAGRKLFAEDGYENTTTSAIARMAGTSESQLIKHFGSKEGLLEAIYDQAWQGMSQGLRHIQETCTSPVDKLRAVIGLLISVLERDKEISTLMLLEGRRIRKHGRLVLLTSGFQEALGIIDGLLKEMREAGRLRQELHPQAIRSALLGSFEGLLRDQLLAERVNYPAFYDGVELRAVFQVVLECFLVTAPQLLA
jgi:AcrR family transcriptional regulator